MEKEYSNLEILRQRLSGICGCQTVKFKGEFGVYSSNDVCTVQHSGEMEMQRGGDNYFVITAGEKHELFGKPIQYAFIQDPESPMILNPSSGPGKDRAHIKLETSSYGLESHVRLYNPIKFLDMEK